MASDEGAPVSGELLNDEAKGQLGQILGLMERPVSMVLFTQLESCPGCATQLRLLRELAQITGKLQLQVFDLLKDRDMALEYKIDKAPATAILGERDHGIRFFGVTAGEEFPSLLEAIMLVSTGRTGLRPEMEAMVRQIKRPVHLQVFVTLTCPFCPRMVQMAHRFAYLNDMVRSDMVDSAEFPDLARSFQVKKVPRTVINDATAFDGAVPPANLYIEMLRAVDPVEYQRIVESLRERDEGRKTRKVDPDHEYEVLVVGGGPAAMSAAIYAARKGLDVALVADRTGGQITYTSSVDNYLGLPRIGGVDLAEGFREHMDQYAIAESFGEKVAKVEAFEEGFRVSTEGGRQLRARSVIYCAGMEYKRLGIPGEDGLIGRGIGFCATCDAPLYADRSVAVVGGGNSAFSAARDLLSYAKVVHLVHRRTEFTADQIFQEQVLASKKVVVHKPATVKAFIGAGALEAMKLATEGGEVEIAVEGAFLEIGLAPNSKPLEGIVQLTGSGEVPVDREQATAVPGLFAAGDVTDVEEKQVAIAVGAGAMAAISAHKYLAAKGLIRSAAGVKEIWQ